MTSTKGQGAEIQPLPILLVEDEELIAFFILEALDGSPYRVVDVASSPDRALTLAEQHKPSLAVVDVRLPSRPDGPRDGIELAHELAGRFGIRSLFITGSGDAVTLDRIRQVAGSHLLSKPFLAGDLLETLKRLVANIDPS